MSVVPPALLFVSLVLARPVMAAPEADPLERGFAGTVQPFLTAYCTSCHGKEKPKADLDLTAYGSAASVVAAGRQWDAVREQVSARDMPPAKASKQPSQAERTAVVAWIENLRREVARRNAGDPGPVPARRLSNSEYDYTVRDLTGVDIRPTKEFPIDPANEAGFDNSGESLAMSPALLHKYVGAARTVADHLVLLPNGLAFAPHPVVSETDRDKYAVFRIMDFYARQPTDLAAYFRAAWRYQHRATLGQAHASLADMAAAEKVSPKYLALVWPALTRPEELGPLAKLQASWRALPPPAAGVTSVPPAVVDATVAMRDYVVKTREAMTKFWANLRNKAVGPGSQPFIIWKNTQYATHRTSYDPAKLYVETSGTGKDEIARRAGIVQTALTANLTALAALELAPEHVPVVPAAFVQHLVAAFNPPNPELAIPPGEDARKRHEAAFARFAQVFPDAFVQSERGRVHLDRPKERADKGRFLSMGGHNMFGYFRDDQPLYELVLDKAGQRELDELWRALDFVTDAPRRQHADFIFYERAEGPRTMKGPEFDFVRSEDKASTSDPMIRRLAKVYVDKARASLKEFGGDAHAISVLEQYFETVRKNLRRVERERAASEPTHLAALVAFAERAQRRPLAAAERQELLGFYRSLRRDGALSHEDALRDALASVLTSPHFLYRVDLVADTRANQRWRPLPAYALASRLSYFLWSSMPDEALLAKARSGALVRPAVLAAEARRMLRDPRARALSVEFGGQWLEFRRFEEHNSVDRARFPSFDGDLRRAMFEEPVRFFDDVIARDRSVLDFLYAKDALVNPVLAKHYGMPVPTGTGKDDWFRVADADKYERGGILPMAVFLTKNAPGLRTSPVKRGYWVVRRALGEHIPPPPAQVPDLPNDEQKMGSLTVRDALAKHREDPACSGCHARFDSFGLVFENFGPIGERRTRDLGGRPVDTRASFPGKDGGKPVEGAGVAGLRAYLASHRQDDFVDNLCRKLLTFALGRTLLLSDDPTIDAMKARLAADGHRFGGLVETIISSPQFRNKRVRDDLALGGP